MKDNTVMLTGNSRNIELIVHNAWKQIDHMGNSFTNYWQHGAAMMVEVNGNISALRRGH